MKHNCPKCGHPWYEHTTHNRAEMSTTHCQVGGFASWRTKPPKDEFIGLHDDCCGCEEEYHA